MFRNAFFEGAISLISRFMAAEKCGWCGSISLIHPLFWENK